MKKICWSAKGCPWEGFNILRYGDVCKKKIACVCRNKKKIPNYLTYEEIMKDVRE